MRKHMSVKTKRILRNYRLECDGCSQNEATEKINAFVLETKRRAKYQKWFGRIVNLIFCVGAVIIFTLIFMNEKKRSGGTFGSADRVDDQLRSGIEDQRRKAALMEKAAEERFRAAPTWRDIEEKEVWIPKQEKQFEKALIQYGGITSSKERYDLIASRVDGKSRQECLMHHKLQQAIAKDQ
uniref:Myb-like domain-containing protein n=2 Tax=Corethron hystrix TaxID=216773 RepID=A0A7S1FNH1_9STRA|mmetsp:Transcript_15849/g.35686  ORF Transcript_15849/g.35686 Transcript_15849/m.35686 type:complete len:182 (+) Transcript_15849:308-853(+)